MTDFIERPRRTKGSGDHDWAEWSDTPLGRGRTCKDCGCEDDGYVQPCIGTVNQHRLVEVWQERDNEVSYRCACGLVSKHQEFGPVPRCPAIVAG